MSEAMLTRSLGDTGIAASAVDLGTWAIGGWMWGGTDAAQSVAAIQASMDEGVTLVDTAPAYGQGVAEEIVGRALKDRCAQVVLATKEGGGNCVSMMDLLSPRRNEFHGGWSNELRPRGCWKGNFDQSPKCGLVWHTRKGNHFFDVDGRPVHRYLSKDAIVHEVEQSLRRLNTDYVDHYITHWQDSTTPVAETMEAMWSLKSAGKIRSIGASNTSPDELADYLEAGGLDAIQEKYSMLERDTKTTLLPLCREHGVSTLSYSFLGLGLLTGRIVSGNTGSPVVMIAEKAADMIR